MEPTGVVSAAFEYSTRYELVGWRRWLPAPASRLNQAVTVATDLDGNPRIVDGDGDGSEVVDMGAYEAGFKPVGGLTVADASLGPLPVGAGLVALAGLSLAGAWVLRRRRR